MNRSLSLPKILLLATRNQPTNQLRATAIHKEMSKQCEAAFELKHEPHSQMSGWQRKQGSLT